MNIFVVIWCGDFSSYEEFSQSGAVLRYALVSFFFGWIVSLLLQIQSSSTDHLGNSHMAKEN